MEDPASIYNGNEYYSVLPLVFLLLTVYIYIRDTFYNLHFIGEETRVVTDSRIVC